jgi:hypothetical protein
MPALRLFGMFLVAIGGNYTECQESFTNYSERSASCIGVTDHRPSIL